MIIFLDFDGVLHKECEENPKFFTQNYLFLKLLDIFPKALVVFTTTWRKNRR